MEHQAIYRKWRPTVFEDIVGQNHITKTLKNQIINNKIGHAYLFCGTRGTGKTTCAKVFARAVNCLNPHDGSPCNECEVCRGILDGSIMDVKEIDAASNNGIDNIREIREDVRYVAANAKYTVYIIDEAHMISPPAFNALLKTLEEPPEHVIFILATTEAHILPQTILSRCQRFDFKRIKPEDIIRRMREIAHDDGLTISEGAYRMFARLADGSMRDGLSILERVVSGCGNMIDENDITSTLGISPMDAILDITDALIVGNVDKMLNAVNDIIADGRDLNVFMNSLIKHFRDLMICKVSSSPEELLDYSADDLVKIKSQSNKITFEKISNAVSLLSDAEADAKWVKSPRVIYELALIKLARPDTDSTPEALMDRLTAMESSTGTKTDPAIERRLNAIEEKLKNGVVQTEETKKSEEKKEQPQKKPPIRLYNPIPENELNADHPFVKIAKNWNNIARSIGNSAPFLKGQLINREITIDADGIILLFNRDEQGSFGILKTFKERLQKAFEKASGSSCCVKLAFRDEIENNIVDFWALDQKKSADDENVKPEYTDPLDKLESNFKGIIENTDDTEFVNYNPKDESFEQSSFEDDREEFLEENELSDDNE